MMGRKKMAPESWVVKINHGHLLYATEATVGEDGSAYLEWRIAGLHALPHSPDDFAGLNDLEGVWFVIDQSDDFPGDLDFSRRAEEWLGWPDAVKKSLAGACDLLNAVEREI